MFIFMFPQCLCLIKGCIHSAWFHNSAIVQHRPYGATSGQFCSSCPHVHRSTGHQLLGPVPPTAREQSRLGPLGTSLGTSAVGWGSGPSLLQWIRVGHSHRMAGQDHRGGSEPRPRQAQALVRKLKTDHSAAEGEPRSEVRREGGAGQSPGDAGQGH